MRFALITSIFLTVQVAYALEQPTLVRVTAYWREEGQLRAASNGARLRNGHCAVDPRKIPYGSRIVLGDEELSAVDTGPAVVSRKAARLSGHNKGERDAIVIDRYFETKSQAMAWEKSHPHFMKVRVLTPEMARAKAMSESTNPPVSRNTAKAEAISENSNSSAPRNMAPQRINRSEPLRPAIPIGDSYFQSIPGSSITTARDARRRTGGDLCLVDVKGSGGWLLDRSRLRRLQIG